MKNQKKIVEVLTYLKASADELKRHAKTYKDRRENILVQREAGLKEFLAAQKLAFAAEHKKWDDILLDLDGEEKEFNDKAKEFGVDLWEPVKEEPKPEPPKRLELVIPGYAPWSFDGRVFRYLAEKGQAFSSLIIPNCRGSLKLSSATQSLSNMFCRDKAKHEKYFGRVAYEGGVWLYYITDAGKLLYLECLKKAMSEQGVFAKAA